MPIDLTKIKQKVCTFFRNTKDGISNRSGGNQVLEFAESALVSNKKVHQSYNEGVIHTVI